MFVFVFDVFSFSFFVWIVPEQTRRLGNSNLWLTSSTAIFIS